MSGTPKKRGRPRWIAMLASRSPPGCSGNTAMKDVDRRPDHGDGCDAAIALRISARRRTFTGRHSTMRSRGHKARFEALQSDMTAYGRWPLSHDVANGISRPGPAGCMVSTAILQCAAENEPVASLSPQGESGATTDPRALRPRDRRGELPAGTDTDTLAHTARSCRACRSGLRRRLHGRLKRLVEVALSAWRESGRCQTIDGRGRRLAERNDPLRSAMGAYTLDRSRSARRCGRSYICR